MSLSTALVALSLFIVSDAHEYDFTITQRLELSSGQSGHSDIRLDLGELPNNSIGLVQIEATNNTDRPLVLGETFSGCKCLQVTLSTAIVEPNAKVDIRLVLSVQKERESSKQIGVHIAPKEQPDAGVRIALRYKVAGLLVFRSQSIAIAFPEDEESHLAHIPILLTPPVEAENLIARWRGDDVTIDGRIEKDSSGWFVALPLPRSVLKGASATGTIEVVEQSLQLKESALCIIELAKIVTVVPSTLRFSWSEESQSWEANAILRLRNNTSEEEEGRNRQLASSDEAKVEAFSPDFKVEVASTSLPKRIVRVVVRLKDMETNVDAPRELFWKVTSGGRTYRSKSSFLVLR